MAECMYALDDLEVMPTREELGLLNADAEPGSPGGVGLVAVGVSAVNGAASSAGGLVPVELGGSQAPAAELAATVVSAADRVEASTFGEPVGAGVGGAADSPGDAPALLAELEGLLARVLVAAVLETTRLLGEPPTRTQVAGYLKARRLKGWSGATGPLCGLFYRLSSGDLMATLERLIELGVLGCHGGTRRLVVAVSARWPEDRVITRALFGEPVSGALATALRAYRASWAQEHDVRAHRVFTNRTLEAIAAAAPTSLRELARVPSVGPITLAEHGEDLVRLVRQHADSA